MHTKKVRNKYSYYAKIMFAISFSLLLYGLILDYKNNKFIDPITNAINVNKPKDNTIHIETTDNDSVDSNSNNSSTNSNDNIKNTTNSNPTNTSGDNKSNQPVESKPKVTEQSQNSKVLTIEDANNQLRQELQNKYAIKIEYGEETRGYTVSGITTEVITDESVINSQLVRLKTALSVYPEGLFREIKNGGIPLTILLVNGYSDKDVTGVTDSSYTDAIISISAAYTFEESFYHESYHYIERYMFKKGANYNTWDTLNPPEFQGWNIIDGSLSYSNTFSPTAPFVNNYAQTEASEDRASTFEYMMASSKASCLNEGNIVWRKAKLIADTMDLVLSSVNPTVTEYWERFL